LQGKRNIIVIQQRLHAKDLAGELIRRDGWQPIILPALAPENDPLGRQPSEPLWQSRFPTETLAAIRNEIGDTLFNALYNQHPITEEGNLFHSRFFEMRYDALPELSLILISIDTAQTTHDKADYTAWTVWGYDGNYAYLIDAERHRVEYPALVNTTRRLIDQHRAHYILIEQSAQGYALLQTLRYDLPHAAIVGVPPIGSKIVRALTASTWFHEARVLLPPQLTPQMHAWLAEMLDFPNAPHDDYVDSTTLALNWLRNQTPHGTWRIVR
jgi:predicted phage terminase large subunit-like protein